MDKIRVLIVDDSSFVRKALLRIFETEPSIEVVGTARNGKEAIDKAIALSPDVITLDIMMPELDGIEALKNIMETCPTRVLMLSQYTKEGAELTLRALELGAMDFIDKSSTGSMDFFTLAGEIISKIKAIATGKPRKLIEDLKALPSSKKRGLIDVIGIGASTGGPLALQTLLSKFPKDIGAGILIVQHMPHGFTGPFAKRLDSICAIEVKEADEKDSVEPGLALIAPAGLHMTVSPPHPPLSKGGRRGVINLDVEPSNTIHKPSIDVLFLSIAKNYGRRSIGVLLTGMGSDGTKGISAIKEEGGTTFAQDEETSVIFGMPKTAIEKGVVDKVLPITLMAEEILKKV